MMMKRSSNSVESGMAVISPAGVRNRYGMSSLIQSHIYSIPFDTSNSGVCGLWDLPGLIQPVTG